MSALDMLRTSVSAALAGCLAVLWAGPARASPRPILVVAGDHENHPYEYLERGKATGFNVDLVRAAAAIAGYDVDVRLMPWSQARRALEQGTVDALSGMYYSEERARLFDFSVPHTMVRSAIFVRKGSPIRSLADLRGKEVILQDGDVLHDLFKRTAITSRILAVSDPDEQLKLLAAGRGDCAVMASRLQGEYYVNRLNLAGLEVIDAGLPQLRYCFATRKGNQELLYRLDEGLNGLKLTGEYQRIYERWFGVYERRDLWRYGRSFAVALAILSGLFAASLLWSRSLKRQVHLRTAALRAREEELRRASAELEQRVDERTAELKRANEQLRVSELEKGLILNSSADLVTFVDSEMRIQWGNRKAAVLAGTSEEELRGRRCFEAFHGRSEPCPGCTALVSWATGEPQSAELSRPEGRTIFHRAFPIRGDDGRMLGAAVFVLDITERKRAEEALREVDRRRSEFLAVLSHELRNPLAPIRSGVFLLAHSPPGSDRAARAIEVIDRQTAHLTRLVDDLLDVTRIAHGKVELQRERLDLADVVRRACDDHRSMFDQRGIGLQFEGPGPVWVDADATRMSQVVGNLLQNAWRFTSRGGTTWVAIGSEHGRAVLRVRDDGAGIRPGDAERIFEPFAQAKADPDHPNAGLGLGLALVKGLVELHGGSVTARSDGPGRGSEFAALLPLSAEPVAMGPRPASPEPPAQRILIVEDNLDAGESLAEVLRVSGHQVHVAVDARSGIAEAQRLKPDVVFCDIGLPDLDGYAVARSLRGDTSLGATRLIALTGYAQPEDCARAREAGFDAHLAKPATLEELRSVMVRLDTGPVPRGAG